MKSYLLVAVLTIFSLFLPPNALSPVPSPASATCYISCTVVEIAEWADTSFPPVNLKQLTPSKNQSSASSTLTLYTNGDVSITADNSDAAQLSKDFGHKLVTKYKLKYDGSGANKTGGRSTGWRNYDRFLDKDSQVKHVSGDGAIEVTLSVKALIETFRREDSGRYDAVQTLTVCWKS